MQIGIRNVPGSELEFQNLEESNVRADLFLFNCLSAEPAYQHLTRSQLKKWIEQGQVLIEKKVISKAGAFLKPGQTIRINLPDAEPSYLEPYEYSLDIVFEDSSLMVVNKPAGISVHPGAGNKHETLLNALVNYLGSDQGAYIVHRLDKDTTGLMIVAKTEAARSKLTQQFEKRTVSRVYNALVMVTPRAKRTVQQSEEGRIETMLGRHPNKRTEMAVINRAGRKAITNWRVLDRYMYASLLEVKLETGRTHQIRVHMEHIGSPVIGDQTYGNFNDLPKELLVSANSFGRQALHAKAIQFEHPDTGEVLSFTSDLPDDFQVLITAFKDFKN